MNKLRQLDVAIPAYGNENTGNAIQNATTEQTGAFEGLIFAEPALAQTKELEDFTARCKRKFGVEKLPNGFWALEAYDTVRLLSDQIAKCGDEVEKLKSCLYDLKSDTGLTGDFHFDSNGDGVRKYSLKKIIQLKIEEVHTDLTSFKPPVI